MAKIGLKGCHFIMENLFFIYAGARLVRLHEYHGGFPVLRETVRDGEGTGDHPRDGPDRLPGAAGVRSTHRDPQVMRGKRQPLTSIAIQTVSEPLCNMIEYCF